MAEILTQTGFDKLLSALDADRDRAGQKYEALRRRLIKFFEWRNCERAEELTDTVFDRVVKKIAEGEEILSIAAYAGGVAQFVFKEDGRRRERLFQSLEDNPAHENLIAADGFADSETDARRLDCMETCLAEFTSENRRLITAYYGAGEQTMIETRRRLAASLGVSLNVLRIRVCRLKEKLENCTRGCCGENAR